MRTKGSLISAAAIGATGFAAAVVPATSASAHSIDATPFGDTGPANPGAVSWHLFHHSTAHAGTNGIWAVYLDRSTAVPTAICNYSAKIERNYGGTLRNTYYSGGYDGCRTTGVPYYPVNRKFESFGSNVDQHNHYLTGTSFTAYWEDQWTNGSYRKVGNHEI